MKTSPISTYSKGNALTEDDYLENKRKIYGQYRPASSKKVQIDDPMIGNYISPRKAVLMTGDDSIPIYNPNAPNNQSNESIKEFETMSNNVIFESCPTCGRKFNKESLEKHKKICFKVFQTKNSKFDSSKQRMTSEEQEDIYNKKKIKDNKFPGFGNKNLDKNTKWRDESNNFQNAMQVAQDYSQAEQPSQVLKYGQCSICK